MLNFFVVTVSEMCGLTFRKYVTEQGIVMQNLWQVLQFFLSHSSIFASKKDSEC